VDENYINKIEIQNFVKEYNFLGYYITSAKTGQGVVEAFNTILENLYHKYKQLSIQE
jgi:lipoprotein NlpI